MTSLNESLLFDIEEINESILETEQNVVFEMARDCSKMLQFLQYSENPEYITEGFLDKIGSGIKDVAKWIFNTFIGFFKLIGKIIKRTIAGIKRFFSSGKSKDHRSIHEMVEEMNYPQHDRIKVKKRRVHVNLDDSQEEQSFDVNLYVQPILVQMQDGETFKLKLTKQIGNFIKNAILRNYGNLPSQFPSISFATPVSIMLFENKKHVMEYLENAIQILEAMFLKKIDVKENENKFISQVNAIINVATHYTKLSDYGFNCTLGQLTDFQDRINKLMTHLRSESEMVQTAKDDPNFKLSGDAIKCLNFIFALLTVTQITINAVGISITNIYVIPEQYTSTINDFDKMGEFVNAMINNNVPAKYVMLNAWLAGTPEFTGNPGAYDEDKAIVYKPIMGHGRGCLFPKTLPDSIYKIALTKRGTLDIANEAYIYNYVKTTPLAKRFVALLKTNEYNTICEMEKIDRTLSSKDTLKYGVKIDKVVNEVNKTLPFVIRDLHTLNFGIRHTRYKDELVIMDYGALKFNDKFNAINFVNKNHKEKEAGTDEQNNDGDIS